MPVTIHFVRQIRKLTIDDSRDSDLAALIDDLDGMVAAHALKHFAGMAFNPTSKMLTRDDLELVCWMMIR